MFSLKYVRKVEAYLAVFFLNSDTPFEFSQRYIRIIMDWNSSWKVHTNCEARELLPLSVSRNWHSSNGVLTVERCDDGELQICQRIYDNRNSSFQPAPTSTHISDDLTGTPHRELSQRREELHRLFSTRTASHHGERVSRTTSLRIRSLEQ